MLPVVGLVVLTARFSRKPQTPLNAEPARAVHVSVVSVQLLALPLPAMSWGQRSFEQLDDMILGLARDGIGRTLQVMLGVNLVPVL